VDNFSEAPVILHTLTANIEARSSGGVMLNSRLIVLSCAIVAMMGTSTMGIAKSVEPGARSRVTYQGFVIEGGPELPSRLSDAPAKVRSAVLDSARTGRTAVYNQKTGRYDLASDENNVPQDQKVPLNVTGGFRLPKGIRRDSYNWEQTTSTKLGVVANPDHDVVAEVDVKFHERAEGHTSDQWKYRYSLHYKRGGLYRLNVELTCAVNKKGKPDDYCISITYPNGKKDRGVTPSHVVEVHDLATGNTVNSNPSGFFGTHSTPPPAGSKQVIKYAHLTESAYFAEYKLTDTRKIRGYDVCVPRRAQLSGVKLCSTSGDGR